MYHSLDICYEIAERLKEPEKISLMMKEKAQRGEVLGNVWSEFSLAWGIPGIVCFYGMMHLNFENEGWDVIAHEYLKHIKKYLETVDNLDSSLFSGLTGMSFAVYLCSENGKRYAKMLSKFDDLLIRQVQDGYLNRLTTYLDPYTLIPSYSYNLASGLSGIIAYLLLRQDLNEFTQQCVDCLVKMLSIPRNIDSQEVFPWFVASHSLGYYNVEQPYRNGFYPLNVAYGIPGALGVLSRAALKGVRVDGLHELIQTLTHWIISKQKIKNNLIYWNPLSPKEDTFDIGEDSNDEGYHWKMGVLGITKCLHLASKALTDNKLNDFCETVLLSHLRSFSDWPKSTDTSISMGKAGLLSLVYNMGCEKEKPFYFEIMKEMERDLKGHYNPLHPFGFQSVDFKLKEKLGWTDIPGLFQGAVGVGLSLLEVQGRVKMPWNQIFLTA